MAWNDQTAPVPTNGGRPDLGSGVIPPRPDAGVIAPTNTPQNPIFNPATPVPNMATNPNAPVIAQAPVAAPIAPNQVAGPAAAPLQVSGDQDQTDAHDDIWIERTKKAIAETQNDPFRQVQLLQHLNKLYLKERYGREVQADKA